MCRIEIQGRFEINAVRICEGPCGSVTKLRGAIQDQSVRHSLLARLHDLGPVSLYVGPVWGCNPALHAP